MKIIKNILNIILAFILIIVIIAMIAMNFVSTKILNKDYILSKLEETEFYLQVSREVQSGFENYIYQSGLPEDTITDLYTEDAIKSDVDSIIGYIYDGTEITTSEEIVRENLDNKINEYVASQGKTLNEQGKENIEKFEDLIVSEYKNNIRVSDKVYDTARNTLQKVMPIYEKIKNLPVIALVIIVILLVIINIKDFLLGINFVSISVLSTGILLKLGKSIVLKYVDIDNLLLISTSLSNLIINITKEILYTISDYGTWFIICGITGIIITAILRNNFFKENKETNKH